MRVLRLTVAGVIFAALGLVPNVAFGAGPALVSLPVISGNLAPGQTIYVSPGSWDMTPGSLSYQWLRCEPGDVNTCSVIVGANSSSYSIMANDVGYRFKVNVTALTAGGGTTVQSPASGAILTTAATTVAPVVSGDTSKGSVLSTSIGTWNVAFSTVSFVWQRCESNMTSSCAVIDGSVGSTYSTVSADVGKYIRSVVSVASTGTYSAGSSPSALVGPISSIPALLGSASIVGIFLQGETLTASLSQVVGYPTPVRSYQWQRCSDPATASCVAISGEVAATHVISVEDINKYVRYQVTLLNNLGGVIVSSEMTPLILVRTKPVNSALPDINGYEAVGYHLTGFAGSWSGLPDPIISFQWQVCDKTDGTTCVDIAGATTKDYYPKFADAFKYLRLKISGTNSVGVTVGYSPYTPKIVLKTTLVSPPATLGFGIVGVNIQVVSASWANLENPVLKTQWQRCSKKDGGDCVDIEGATALNYKLVTADEGKFVRVRQYVVDQTLPVVSPITGDPIYPEVINTVADATKPAPATTPVTTKPATKPVAKPVVKATTITCVKGSLSKKVTAVSPKCPTGYKKK